MRVIGENNKSEEELLAEEGLEQENKNVKAAKRNKKPKEPKAPKEKKGARGSIRTYALAILLTVIVYIGCIIVQRVLNDTEQRISVYVAKIPCTEGVFITDKNFFEYFTSDIRVASSVPSGYIVSPEQVYSSYINRPYEAKDIITINGFDSELSLISGIANPVELAFNASGLPQAVSGIIRAGDRVNIYSIEETNQNGETTVKAVEIYHGAYISKAFTSSGTQLSRLDEGSEATALMFNIVIAEDVEGAFNEALANGTLRLSKQLYEATAEDESILPNSDSTGVELTQPTKAPTEPAKSFEELESTTDTETETETETVSEVETEEEPVTQSRRVQ